MKLKQMGNSSEADVGPDQWTVEPTRTPATGRAKHPLSKSLPSSPAG